MDLHVSDSVTARGLALLDDPCCAALAVDLAAVTFMDSVGLAALLHLRKTAADRGTAFALRSTQPRVQMLLKLTGLAELFGIEPTAELPVPTPDGIVR